MASGGEGFCTKRVILAGDGFRTESTRLALGGYPNTYLKIQNFAQKFPTADTILLQIKPHYRSEGPRQGSCGIFGGCFILSRLLLCSI